MHSAFELIICALATHRLAMLITREAGPLNLFGYVRHWLGYRELPNGAPDVDPGSPGDLISCLDCMSIWMAFVVFGIWYAGGWLFLVILALSDLAMFWDRFGRFRPGY